MSVQFYQPTQSNITPVIENPNGYKNNCQQNAKYPSFDNNFYVIENDGRFPDLSATHLLIDPNTLSNFPNPIEFREVPNTLPDNECNKPVIQPIRTNTYVSKKRRRNRIVFTDYQLSELDKCYQKTAYLSKEVHMDLSKRLGLTENHVRFWFQNRRQRKRKLENTKTTENSICCITTEHPRSKESSVPPVQEQLCDTPLIPLSQLLPLELYSQEDIDLMSSANDSLEAELKMMLETLPPEGSLPDDFPQSNQQPFDENCEPDAKYFFPPYTSKSNHVRETNVPYYESENHTVLLEIEPSPIQPIKQVKSISNENLNIVDLTYYTENIPTQVNDSKEINLINSHNHTVSGIQKSLQIG